MDPLGLHTAGGTKSRSPKEMQRKEIKEPRKRKNDADKDNDIKNPKNPTHKKQRKKAKTTPLTFKISRLRSSLSSTLSLISFPLGETAPPDLTSLSR